MNGLILSEFSLYQPEQLTIMSLQAENAKQLLLSIVNQLDQHTWDKLSSLEKEQVKRKLVEAFDQLFPIQNLLADKEPLTQVKEAIIVPLVKEKQEEKIQEIPEEVKPVVVKETPEPLVEVAEIVEQKSEPSVEIKEEIKTPVPPVAQEEEDSHKASLNEKFTQEKTTLADKIARPQGSLKTSIDVNENSFLSGICLGQIIMPMIKPFDFSII
jgi:hypothetical protein